MRTISLAAMLLIGAGLAAGTASAAPLASGLASLSQEQVSQATQVGEWKGKHKRRFRHRRFRDDDDFSFHFGFGVPFGGYALSPYYYDRPDCIGWWHRHWRGRLHCHGQLVYD